MGRHIPTKLDLILQISDHLPDPIDDEPMTEESPGVWTWQERRLLAGGRVVTVTRCHVDADPSANILPTSTPHATMRM
jgi:hypothetical protein